MTELSFIQVERDGHVATVTINRQEKLNALSPQVVRELNLAFHRLVFPGEGESPRAVILTGAGDKAFVAGADIAEMAKMNAAQAKAFADTGHRLGAMMETAPFPVIAAVNGFALGGGCEIALCCDFIYASDKAKFGQPEVNLAVIPGFGGTQRLARRVGIGHARELVYSGKMINAQEALRIGLVNQVVPHAELLSKVREIAAMIASKGPVAVAAAKRTMLRGVDQDLVNANELEAAEFAVLFGTDDQKEGMQAFLEKRSAAFQGR
ncbi:MAG: enoyl-CoA hydratase-related protein [Polyangiaceae bacterium]|nr:enoyl-CoA hydratase-related protein [Polyangiaceae bacterium]